jgi:hypothetical protein
MLGDEGENHGETTTSFGIFGTQIKEGIPKKPWRFPTDKK